MLKKLRVKFILMMMSFTILLLGSIFGLIYHFTAADLAQSSFEMMQAVALRPSRPERPGSAPDSVRLPFFTVEVSKTGAITAAGSDLYDLSDEDFLRELVLAAQADGKNDGLLSSYHLRFFRAVTPDGEKYVFADTSAEQATLHGLIRTSVLIGLGSLAVFFALSVLLARWAVRPVELAWRQQKQFVADASHELKTPLSVILTNAELLQSAQGGEARQRFSANVLTAATQMRALVSGLLDLVRSDQTGLSSARERLDWSKTVLDACLPFEPVFFERGLTFSYDVEPGLFVLGDAAQLSRCVDILLDNAQIHRVRRRRSSGPFPLRQSSLPAVRLINRRAPLPRRLPENFRALCKAGWRKAPGRKLRSRPVHRRKHCLAPRRKNPGRGRGPRKPLFHRPSPLQGVASYCIKQPPQMRFLHLRRLIFSVSIAQLRKKRPATGFDIPVGSLKIVCVPRVRHIARRARKVQQQPELPLRIASKYAAHAGKIAPVHADEKIVGAVVRLCDLPRRVRPTGNTVRHEHTFGRWVDRVSELFAAHCRRVDEKLLLPTRLTHHMLQNKLRHRTAADVAVANE